MMSRGGNGNAESIALLGEFPDRGKRFCVEFRCDCLGAFRIEIVNSDQIGVFRFAVNFRMVPAENADSDDSDLDFIFGRCSEHDAISSIEAVIRKGTKRDCLVRSRK